MATTISTLIAQTRREILKEVTPRFWSDAELLVHAIEGIRDLWKKIVDLHKDHFLTTDATNVSLAASTGTLTGVPTDVFRVRNIRPRVLGSASANPGLIFKGRDNTSHPDFVQAEARRAVEPRHAIINYVLVNAGAPVGAPSIRVAPHVSSAVLLTLEYIPVLGAMTDASVNPIPGESDKAVKHFIAAFARTKERPARDPDPEHVSIYATEARNLLTVLTPRTDAEPEYVVGMWEGGYEGADG